MFNKKKTKQKGGLSKAPKKFGNKLEVWKGLALQTSGGITKDGLKYNSKGDIVYKKASNAAKKKSNLSGFIYNAKKTPGEFKKQPKKGTAEYYKLLEKTQQILNYSSDSSNIDTELTGGYYSSSEFTTYESSTQ
jgi:hypothetical protein